MRGEGEHPAAVAAGEGAGREFWDVSGEMNRLL